MNLNQTINRDRLIGQLNWRYATKQFDLQRKIDAADWAALEESLLLTPSSFGLQPWKFVVVTDLALRQKLVPASWGQTQVAEASHLVVFAIKKNLTEQDVDNYLDRIAEVRGVSRESLNGFRDMLVGGIIKGMDDPTRKAWAARQVYIALGNFLNSAALLGIDACPMEGIQADKYDEILGLDKQGLSAVVVAAAGYRASKDPYAALKKVRFPKEEVFVKV
jgi:nitroreductase